MKIETNFYTITPYQNMLFLEILSSWDDKVHEQHIADVRKLEQELFDGPWALLVDARNWELHTPDAENLGKKAAMNAFGTNLTYNAIVVGESAIKKWQMGNMLRDSIHFESKIFQAMEDAKAWLESHGYTMIPLEFDIA